MNKMITGKDFSAEFVFTTSRSSGPGGQHVNKTSTRVELRFHIGNSSLLTEDEKERIRIRLASGITKNDELIIVSQVYRSQLKNKLECIDKFYRLLTFALKRSKKRVKTVPTNASRVKRREMKEWISRKKRSRRGGLED